MRLAVCYQNVDPKRGGAETYVADLCRGLVASGHEVDLLAEGWAAGVIDPAVHCVPIAIRGATRLGRIWSFAVECERRLARAAARYDCTVGLIGTWGTDVLIPQGGVRAASLDCNARRFTNPILRNGYRALKRVNLGWHVWQAIEKRQYDTTRGTRVVAVSQMVRGHLQRYHGLDPRRVCVIPNAIDAGRLRLDDALTVRAALRRRLGLAETDVLALFLAHNFRLKGLAPLLRALKRRRERDPRGQPLHLAVCGGGDPAPFRRLADRLDIGSHVHFLGFQPDVRPIVRAADYFVLPTYFDPCSLVVFEALACGLPVITTRLNGAGELITPGREGFVVETPDSIAELAEALASLTDPEIRLSMAEHARRLGAEQTFEKHLHSLVALFGEVAADRAGAALNRPHALPRHARGPCVSEMAASTPSHGPGSSEPRP